MFDYSVSKYKNMSDGDLADVFLREFRYENIIAEIFKFFRIDCTERCKINPERLDKLVEEFYENKLNKYDALTGIIHMFRELGEPAKTKDYILFDDVVAYIDEHLTESFGIEEMAKELNVSYYYMCHMFKRCAGETISNYRNKKRVRLAQRMLVEADKKIADIASSCGYDNSSYFTEIFTKLVGVSPVKFREEQKDTVYFSHFYENDIALANMLPSIKLSGDIKEIPKEQCTKTYNVHMPDDEYKFLHETAIIEYKGVLFASWYNCPETELAGRTPIRGRRSYDGGKTWSDVEIIADDPTGDIMYCPPVYGICDGKLYLFLNQMVAPDHIHSLDLFIYNEEEDKFVKLWSRPVPFKLNTNVVALPSGKLMLPGRCGELDRFPNTPAVLISDSGKIDSEWRLVHVAENGTLPDGECYVHPESSVFTADGKIFLLCRNDLRMVPIVYISEDNGETWSEPYAYDLPFINSKIYSGDLTDGRHYIIGNINKKNREELVIYFTEDERPLFTKKITLQNGGNEEFPNAGAWHYPVAYESNGKLYIIYTVHPTKDWTIIRGAVITVVELYGGEAVTK